MEIINTCFATTDYIRPVAYYAHLVPLAVGLCISIFIIIKGRLNLLSGSFFTLVFFLNLWLIGDLVTWTTNNYSLVNTAWQILDFINILAFLGVVYFFDTFSYGKVSNTKKIILIILSLPAIYIGLLGNAITGFDHTYCESIENNFMTMYKIIVEGITILLVTFTLFRSLKILDNMKKKAAIYIYSFLILFLLIFSTTEYWASVFDFYEISLYGLFVIPIFQLAILFVISQFGIFNLKSWNQQLIGYVLVIMIASQLFFLQNTTDLALNLFTLFVAFSLAYFLNRSIKREIEDKRKIEELATTLARANERLKELDAQKSEFLSLASHQLRGPLAAIKGYASLILEGDFGKIEGKVKEAIETISRSTQTLVVLVDDYLSVSRLEQGRMKYDFSDFSLGTLTEQVVKELTPSVEMAGLKLHIQHDPTDTLLIHGDEGKIKQVISNLIDNAIKYTKKGSIDVCLERTKDDKVLLKIKDTGVGITGETMSRLFERFARANDASKTNTTGTGLGLYVAKKMIEAHKGRIWAESEGKDKGSTFIVELEALHKIQ